MSRAFKIQVQESLRTVVKGSDHIGTKLELLEVLPAEQLAELLVADLKSLGFEQDEDSWTREKGGVVVRINPQTGDVKVSSELCEEVEVRKKNEALVDEDWGTETHERLRESLREATKQDLEEEVSKANENMTAKATEQLEAALRELQGELDGIVNRVTAAALKKKAASLGEIKSISEDEDTGSMTIVLEV